jgi:hypothetical protein
LEVIVPLAELVTAEMAEARASDCYFIWA